MNHSALYLHRAAPRLLLAFGLLLFFAGRAAALPILSEIYYDAPGSDDGQLFVEIAGSPGEPLDGLVLEGVNGSNGAITHTIVLSGTIGADGLFVLADGTSAGTTTVPGADQIANFDFQQRFASPQVLVFTRSTYLCQASAWQLRVGHTAASVSLLCRQLPAQWMNAGRAPMDPVSELRNGEN